MEAVNGHATAVAAGPTNRLAALPSYPDHPSEIRAKSNGHASQPTRNPAAAGRFRDLNAFVDTSMADLSRAELATWLALFRNAREGVTQTAIETLSKVTGTSRPHVIKAIGKLCERGLIDRIRTGALNRGASVYRVHPLPKGQLRTGNP
jgi:predicted transcriptional regulator